MWIFMMFGAVGAAILETFFGEGSLVILVGVMTPFAWLSAREMWEQHEHQRWLKKQESL